MTWWRTLTGLYPEGHPYHQPNPIMRYYVVAAELAALLVGLVWLAGLRLPTVGVLSRFYPWV